MNPSLSIITINFNNRIGLQKTIESVVCQRFTDYEWIVIDGGSTDGSIELIEQYAEHFSYWVSEPDDGVYNAMNKGIAKAHGEYLNFMNSGDIFSNEFVLNKVFEYSLYQDLVFGNWCLSYPNKQVIVKEPETLSLHRLLFWSICHQAMFIKSSLLKQKGYDESYRIISDWKRWIEIVGGGGSILYIPELICTFDCSGMSFTNTQVVEAEKKRLFEKDLVQFKKIRDFYKINYDSPGFLPIYDVYSTSKSNRRIIKLALRIIDVKNRLFKNKIVQ